MIYELHYPSELRVKMHYFCLDVKANRLTGNIKKKKPPKLSRQGFYSKG